MLPGVSNAVSRGAVELHNRMRMQPSHVSKMQPMNAINSPPAPCPITDGLSRHN